MDKLDGYEEKIYSGIDVFKGNIENILFNYSKKLAKINENE